MGGFVWERDFIVEKTIFVVRTLSRKNMMKVPVIKTEPLFNKLESILASIKLPHNQPFVCTYLKVWVQEVSFALNLFLAVLHRPIFLHSVLM